MKFEELEKKNLDAENKAKELWGHDAFARIKDNEYYVGVVFSIIYHNYGVGLSWDSAFESAKLNLN